MKTFSIVFSNYTAKLFAWEGSRSKFTNKEVLGNREVIGEVQATSEAEALEEVAPDTVRFTRALKAATALEDRSALIEAMWAVALADGVRDAEEDRLLRMVASLLGLTDVESGLARRRAEAR